MSSYRHALRHGSENRGLCKLLGRPVAERGLSFVEVLEYLRAIDLESCDPHLKQQYHRFESGMPAVHVINADRKPLLEAETARLAHTHHARPVGLQHDCSRVVLNASSTIGEWPDCEAILKRQTRGDSNAICRADFEKFGPFL